MQYVTKTRQENYMSDRTCVIYAKNDIELSWLVRPSVNYDKN